MTDTVQTTPEVPQEPIKAPALPHAIHANLKEYRRRLGVWRVLLAFALTFIFLVRFGWVVWVFSVIALVLILGIILWFLGKRSLTLTAEGIEFKNALGRGKTLLYSDIEGAKVFVNYYDTGFGIMPRLSIASKSKEEGITLIGMFWPVEELDAILATLREKNITAEYYEDAVTYTAITQQFPKYGTYVERHPGKIVAISLVAIVAVCVGIALFMTSAL